MDALFAAGLEVTPVTPWPFFGRGLGIIPKWTPANPVLLFWHWLPMFVNAHIFPLLISLNFFKFATQIVSVILPFLEVFIGAVRTSGISL